ncbi:MAG: helix-turn-helix transcriptional regulator [Clostridia bacterium]|nr:helix-turn-helix transcriptional regulator [Clostridia bacterium]
MNLANRIQTLRKQNGMSQEILAEQLGVSRQAVSKWESEQSTPDIENIIALSDLFDVTTDYLLKGEDSENNNEKISLEIKLKNEIPDLIIFVSSVLNIIGVATGYNWMKEYRDSRSFYSFIFIFAATLLFVISSRFFDKKIKENKIRWFVNINIWLYAAYSWCYFEFISNYIPYIISAIIHVLICIVIIVPFNIKAGKEKNPNKKLKKYVKITAVFSVITIIFCALAIIGFFILLFGGEEVVSLIPALIFAVIYLVKSVKDFISCKNLL